MKSQFQIKKDYDFQSDILYLRIVDDYRYKESLENGNNLILDFDNHYRPVAVEILDTSKVLNISKYSLQTNFNLDMEISVGEDLIAVRAQFVLSLHQKRIPIVKDFRTLNDIHLPSQEVGLVME
ncbi:MAG: DUF2283 domain-containing protein [Methanobacteriaceae archaeon]